MNMERVEERCLACLRQTQNPLVPVDTLLEYCQKEDGLEALGRDELLVFLRAHGEIHVLEGPEDREAITLDHFSSAGLAMGPRAILYARMPSPPEMTAMFAGQLNAMMETLGNAFEQAQAEGDAARASTIRDAMAQAEELRTRLKIFVSHEGK